MPGPPLMDAVAELRLRPLHDRRHVAQPEHAALRRRAPTPPPSASGVSGCPFGPHHDPLVGVVEHARAADAGGPPRRLHQLGQRQAVGAEPRRIGLHLQLAHLPAEDGDLGDARRGEQPGPDHPVHEGALLHRSAGRRGEPHHQHGARGGGQRREHRRLHRPRAAAGPAPPAAPPAAGAPRGPSTPPASTAVMTDSPWIDCERTTATPFDAVDRVLDRLGDEDLDLLRREPGRLGLDRDLRRRELGKDIELCPGDDRDAVGHQRRPRAR